MLFWPLSSLYHPYFLFPLLFHLYLFSVVLLALPSIFTHSTYPSPSHTHLPLLTLPWISSYYMHYPSPSSTYSIRLPYLLTLPSHTHPTLPPPLPTLSLLTLPYPVIYAPYPFIHPYSLALPNCFILLHQLWILHDQDHFISFYIKSI